MAKLPAPPDPKELRKIAADLKPLPRGTILYRLYFKGGPYPVTWNEFRSYGPLGSRFDHHTLPQRNQRRRILYGALDGPTCFAEFFQQTRVIDRMRNAPWLVAFGLRREIELLDLTGAWPTRAGASQALNTGPRSRARPWSRAIYDAYPGTEGLHYRSSMSARLAVALYERALDALPVRLAFHVALSDSRMTRHIEKVAKDFGYDVL